MSTNQPDNPDEQDRALDIHERTFILRMHGMRSTGFCHACLGKTHNRGTEAAHTALEMAAVMATIS